MLAFLSQGGGRRIIGVTVGAAIIVWIQAQRELKVRRLAIAAAAVVGLLAAMQFMLNIRSVGYEEFMFRGESEYDYLHVDDNFLRLAQVIQIVPAEHPYVGLPAAVVHDRAAGAARVLARQARRSGFRPAGHRRPEGRQPVDVDHRRVVLELRLARRDRRRLAARPAGADRQRAARARGATATNPIVYGLAVMVLVSGMRSMQDLVIMSYALVAWWLANRLTRERAIATR